MSPLIDTGDTAAEETTIKAIRAIGAAPGNSTEEYAAADEDYLADSVARVCAMPGDVANWQDLSAALPEPGARARHQAVLETVRALRTAQPLAAYLRASFLYRQTGDPQELARAGRALIDGGYAGRDRLLLTLLNLAWARALALGEDRGALWRILKDSSCAQALGCLAADLAAGGPWIAPRERVRTLARVAVLAPSLGGFDHAPTALALNHAALLASMGLEVRLFSTQDMTVPHVATCIVDADLPQFSKPDVKSWKLPIAGRFDVTLPDSRLTPAARWRNALRQIARFDPDLVLFVGLMSPLLPQLFAARPLVALPVNSVAAIGPHDVWLCADPEAEAGADWAPDYAAGAAFRYPYRIALPPEGMPISRHALGLPQDALVLVSVGFRLRSEIRGTWAARMEAFLEAHPQMQWLLIGSGPQMPPALANRSRRIHSLPPRPDVRAVCRACDICVNPPRAGGGFSVLEAMAVGLPVLALGGSDGGAKTGEHALSDEDEYFSRLEQLARDASERKTLGAALKARFDADYDLNLARAPLARAMALARELYLRRCEGAKA